MNNTINNRKNKQLNKKNTINLIEGVFNQLENTDFLRKYVIKNTAFTRERKIPIEKMFKLVFAKAFLSLNVFLSLQFKKQEEKVTKQAYSKARTNVDYNIFTKLNEDLIEQIYGNYKLKKFNNYLIFSIDGTTVELPNTKELKEVFGEAISKKGAKTVARASASCIFDSLNNITITSTIERYGYSEREMAIKMLDKVNNIKALKDENIINIMDRGYYSTGMLLHFCSNNWKFLFRLSKGHLKKYFKKMQSNDEIFTINLEKLSGIVGDEKLKKYAKEQKQVDVRFIKVMLKTGEVEYLITNVMDIKYDDMQQLYFLRWRIEENYKFIKRELELENFSGKKEISIKQDFYSSILNANINQLIRNCCKTKKTKKHEYQVNMNVLRGLYKQHIAYNIFTKVKYLLNRIRKIIKELERCLIIKSTDKSCPRNTSQRVRANRYFTNCRPC